MWNSQETKADDREEDKEKHNWDSDKKFTYLLGSKKKRILSIVEGKSASKLCVKCRRCSSPNRGEVVGGKVGVQCLLEFKFIHVQ